MFKALILLSVLTSLHSGASESLSYSGRLVNANGSPVTGPVNLKFDFAYTDAPTTVLCTQQIAGVALTNGVFHVKLDPTCSPSWTAVLAGVPANEALAIRVTDESHTKTYSYQALHSMPFATMSSMTKQLAQLGATPGQILAWDGTKWAPTNESGTGNGTVTSIATGTGLTGGTITATGTIAIANGGVDTAQLADGAVTDQKVASGIARNKLANGTASHVLVNDGSGVISSVAQLPITHGGTGAASAAAARTNLGLGTAAVVDLGTGVGRAMPSDSVPVCFAFEKLQMTAGPAFAWACVPDNDSADNTKLPLDGSAPMAGTLDMNSNKIVDLPTPTADGDAATKLYVDSQVGAVNPSQWLTNTTKIYYNGGNVGIGTNNPTRLLHVYGGGDSKALIEGNDGGAAGLVFKNTQGDVGVGIGSDENFHIGSDATNPGASTWLSILSTNGNIGVGTLSPTEKFDVAGNIALTGKLRMKSDNANFVELQAPEGLAATLNFKLPGVAGSAGNALVTDGAGNLSWSAVATGASAVGGDLTGTITNAQLGSAVVTDAEVAAGAAIAQSKIANLTTDLAAKEPTISAGTTAQYWRGDKTWQTLSTSAVTEGTNLYFTEPRVLGTDLAGFSSAAGAISSTDTVLSAFEKLDGNISALSTAATSSFVNVTGDTMSGPLVLNADPTAALGAATKQYVDSQITGSTYWTKTVNDLSYTNGYVGIGTSTPTSPLDIRTAVTAPMALTRYSDTAVQGTGVIYNRARGTQAAPAAVQSGDKISTIANVFGYDGDSYVTAAGINVAVDGTPGDGDMPGRLEFIVQGDNQGAIVDSITPAMVIKHTGYVGIGTTSPFGALHVGTNSATSSSFIVDTSKVNQGSIRITNDATANYIQSGVDVTSGSAKDLRFGPYLNSTPWMTITATGNLGVGNSSPAEKIDVTGNIALTGKVRMKSDTANYVEFKAPASLASTQTLTWPGTSGAAGNALTTDGAGNLSWSAIATTATSVGGDLTGTIANAQIAAASIVNADISESANISQSKINGLTTALAGKEPSIAAGTTAQYRRGDKTWQTLNTTAVPEGTNLYFLDSRVRAALMSGYAVGSALPLAATDTLVEAIGKLEAQIIANDTAFDNSGVWSKNGTTVHYNGGSVGIGTNNPVLKFHVADGGIFSSHAGTDSGMYFGAHSSGYGILQATNAANTGGKNLVLQQYGGLTGIGTNAPTEALHVANGAVRVSGGVSATNVGGVFLDWNGASNVGRIIAGNASGSALTLSTNSGAGTTTERVRIDSNGNVGIGYPSPLEKLVVGAHAIVAHDGGNKVLGFNTEYDATNLWSAQGGGAYWGILDFGPATGHFHISSGTANGGSATNAKMSILSTGNVGIGTTDPTLGMSFNPTNKLLTVEANGAGGSTLSGGLILGNGGAMADTYELGHINFVGRQNGTDLDGNMARITARASGTGGVDGFGGTLQFFTKGDNVNGSATERMRISAAGNVGIGTLTPTSSLDVNGGITVNQSIRANNQGADPANRGLWMYGNSTSLNGAYIGLKGSDADNGAGDDRRGTIDIGAYSAGGRPGSIHFFDYNGASWDNNMIILPNGNIGIGTSSPINPLHVESSTNANVLIKNSATGDQCGGLLTNMGSDPSNVSWLHTCYQGGVPYFKIGVSNKSYVWQKNPFSIDLRAPDTTFFMNSAGNVGIGHANPGYKLDVVGDINASGSVRAAGVALTSDKRFKKDIKVINDALEKIMSIRGVSYNWNHTDYPERNFVERHQIGVIAQEVEKVFPELVDTDKNGFKSVNYPALVAPLIESTKSLKMDNDKKGREIASLKEKTDKLVKENADMRARLDRLEKALLKR